MGEPIPLSRWEQEQVDTMDEIFRTARRQRSFIVEREAVDDAKMILGSEVMHPSVRVMLAHERLAAAYKTLEGLQDG